MFSIHFSTYFPVVHSCKNESEKEMQKKDNMKITFRRKNVQFGNDTFWQRFTIVFDALLSKTYLLKYSTFHLINKN